MSDAVDILLVEDNDDDAELVMKGLGNYRCLQVKDGVAALDFVLARGAHVTRNLNQPPRLILLDIKLPRLDGIDVLRELKGHPVAKTIPMVMLTSSNHAGDMQACYEAGANSYVVKPLHFRQFSETVSAVCQYWLTVNQLPK